MELASSNNGQRASMLLEGNNSSNCLDFRESQMIFQKKQRIRKWVLLTALAAITLIVLTTGFIIYYFLILEYEWLDVHLIPHSHDDVGWLKTPETYYYTDVKYILDNVVQELQENPDRRFVYAESYFFWKWWQEKTDETRSAVRVLLENGQLEVVGGGWTMSDEAVTHYQSFIDQTTWGFRQGEHIPDIMNFEAIGKL